MADRSPLYAGSSKGTARKARASVEVASTTHEINVTGTKASIREAWKGGDGDDFCISIFRREIVIWVEEG